METTYSEIAQLWAASDHRTNSKAQSSTANVEWGVGPTIPDIQTVLSSTQQNDQLRAAPAMNGACDIFTNNYNIWSKVFIFLWTFITVA